ncbi:MAG: hypothetical protein J7513_07630 [Solirubrobacteraceae bacterium]|nr:hypothetical protein [Solirubrobacteraceae bacterium]
MSRVTRSTFRSAAATTLALAATLGLASCGGSDEKKPERAGATTPVPTRPPQKPLPDVIKSDVAVTEEGAKAIADASTKKVGPAQVKSEASEILKAIKAAGISASRSSGSSGGPTVIQAGSTTVMVYPSEQLAATQAASFVRVIDTAKTDGRIARYDRVVIATSAVDGMTKKLRSEFKKIQKAVKSKTV